MVYVIYEIKYFYVNFIPKITSDFVLFVCVKFIEAIWNLFTVLLDIF